MDTEYYQFKPDYKVCPGETLKESIEFLNISIQDASIKSNININTLNSIILGEYIINVDIANKLEDLTGIDANLWLNLEKQYREQ